ncbi:MAG: thioredoxin family protein [Planctomycetia bacterium]|nr:thioredoxin family protein [Planctomycetia bacterium]
MQKTLPAFLFLTSVFAVNATAGVPDAPDEPRPQAIELPRDDADEGPAGPPTWHKSLEPALREARERKALVFVRVGAEWCGWCRKLEREMEKPEVQQELARWVLVELDADDDADEVQKLNVGPIPALRILDAAGGTLRSRDGYLAARTLVDWLRRAADPNAAGDSGAPIAEIPELSADTLPKFIRLLGHRDAELRDEVIRRISLRRDLSAAAVAGAFRSGNLATRLSALEILSHWKAPIADLDPWDPATLTTQRLDELATWAAHP